MRETAPKNFMEKDKTGLRALRSQESPLEELFTSSSDNSAPRQDEAEKEFQTLLRHIRDARGFDCRQYKPNYLKRRIGVRMRATGATSYLGYLSILKKDPSEYKKLLDDLTINVTEFFRDQDVYQALRDKVVPEILRIKRQKKSYTIRVWSAGCATGEEPYSLAIILYERISGLKDRENWSVRIVATDLDEMSLNFAKRAIYPNARVLPGDSVERYFIREGEGFRVREEILHMVKFSKADLMHPPSFKYLDLIVCRNVLIYFGKEMQQRILEYFHRALHRDGFLVLGKSEAIMGVSVPFEPFLRRERVYKKKDAQGRKDL